MNLTAFKLLTAVLSVITLERSWMVLSYQSTRICTRFVRTLTSRMTNDAAAAKKSAIAVGKKIGVNSINRHIFLCADQTKPKCCSLEAGLESWDFLKARLKKLNLVGPNALISRTKANCLQVCISGPIAVVYPEGVWYHSCTPAVLEEIIQSHLINGIPYEGNRFDQKDGDLIRDNVEKFNQKHDSTSSSNIIKNTIDNSDIEKFDIDNRFTDSIKFNNMVFISGQVGDGDTIEEQTVSALNYVDLALSKAGTNKSRILELTIWLQNIDADYNKMNIIYDNWITPGSPPTRACVEAKLASPKYKIEIRVIAAAL